MSTMVDSKIGKTFQRSVGRAKEKILQNLGKVDRTADEILDEHINGFNKQQYAATRLQKELNNYIRCIRACATSSRALLEAVNEVYEPEWGGKELLTVNSQSCELLWNDFAHRLAEQVLIPLNTYQGQFPEMRKKIEKRGRKLVDFDGERHALQAMQSNPRRAETKLTRQRENLEAAKRTYEVLNSELHDELPALFNSRIVFLVSAMSTLFASEHIFHSESSKVFTELEGIVEKLAKDSAKGNMNFQLPSNAVLNNTSDSQQDVAKNGSVSPVSKTSSHPASTPVTPTTPTSKLPMEEPCNITSNGVSKTNGSIKTDTNLETKSEKGNLDNNPSNSNNLVSASADVVVDDNNDEINPVTAPETSTPSPPQRTSSTQAVNGVNADAAANKTNTDLASNPVITPSTPAALPDSSTSPASKDVEGSNDNPKAPSSTSTVNGTHEHQSNDGANKQATPSSPEREEPDSLDTDTKIRAVDTQPEHDSLTSSEQVDSNNNKDESRNEVEKSDVKNQDEEEINNNDAVEANKNLKNNKIAENDVASAEPIKPLHGILSTSKHRMGNGRTESPFNDRQVPSSDEPGVLYRVRATYRYQKEDVDELSFDAGEIIRVIEYDDPEEQEEGWLMGVKDNGEKGMFPANFTRPL